MSSEAGGRAAVHRWPDTAGWGKEPCGQEHAGVACKQRVARPRGLRLQLQLPALRQARVQGSHRRPPRRL
eukprot:8124703-Pyramimonas_sp.AAC.1